MTEPAALALPTDPMPPTSGDADHWPDRFAPTA